MYFFAFVSCQKWTSSSSFVKNDQRMLMMLNLKWSHRKESAADWWGRRPKFLMFCFNILWRRTNHYCCKWNMEVHTCWRWNISNGLVIVMCFHPLKHLSHKTWQYESKTALFLLTPSWNVVSSVASEAHILILNLKFFQSQTLCMRWHNVRTLSSEQSNGQVA